MKSKLNKLSFLLLLANTFISAQSYDDLSSNSNYNIIPPTPESYYKAKFGNTEINDFKGEPTVNIPLFSLSKKDIVINLGLKYIKAGVKVNDISNSTGINWILDTGGSITRTIYDKRDEFFGNTHLINHSLPSIDQYDTQGWGAYISLHNQDHEIDVFNYSISGYSGSFYLDEHFNPVLIDKDNNLKIETIGNFREDYAFKITTYDGLVYLFGGDGFTEKTFNRENPASVGVTGFYLKQISSNKTNRSVNFQYENMTPKTVILNEQQNAAVGSVVVYEDACGGSGNPSSDITSSDNILHITSLKRLKQIVADDNETFTFNYSNDYVLYNKLNEIGHSNGNNPIRKASLEYVDKKSGSILERFFLTKVAFYEYNNSLFNKKEDYLLEYNTPLDIPVRLSKEIDYLGFYNGKVGNTNLIPNTNFFDDTNFSIPAYFADRTPDFNYSVNGTLKSITYPTKGKTNFEYEPVKKGTKENDLLLELNNTKMTDMKELNQFEFIGGSIQLSISLYSPDLYSPIKAWADFKIFDDNNTEIYTHAMSVTKTSNHLVTDLDNFILDTNKKYKFIYQIQNNKCNDCQGNVIITYKAMDPLNGAGIRLKRQFDTVESDTVNIKRVYYTNFDKISEDLFAYREIVPKFNTYSYIHSVNSTTEEAATCAVEEHRQFAGWGVLSQYLDSSPLAGSLTRNSLDESLGYFNLADPMYENVTISYGGDHFEKGGEEKKYYIKNRNALKTDLYMPATMEMLPGAPVTLGPSILANIIPSAQKRLDRYYSFSNIDGKLLKNSIFYMKNNIANLKQSTLSSYTFEHTSPIYNIIGSVLYPNLYTDPTSIINKYITSYPVFTSQSFLNKVVHKDYLEDIPLNTQDDSNVKKIVTLNEYQYNNIEKQLTNQKQTFSDGIIQNTNYQYAHEKGDQLLIDRNMVGIPLETTTIQTKEGVTKTLGKTEVIYPISLPTTQSGSLVLPLSVKSSDQLTGVMSTEVSYDKYDEKGNILQYTGKDGIPVTIVWGYNKTQPIAKVEGITYDDLLSLASPTAIIGASNEDAADPSKEAQLLEALNTFRKNTQLSDKKVTTYTYDPLIGVTSITPPSGIRQVFTYDAANRLKETKVRSKDNAGAYTDKKAAEYKYNYKP